MRKGLSSLKPRPGWYLLVLAGLYFLFVHRLADRDLWSSHEARAGMNARSLLAGTGWPVPHLADGRPDLQKPPLYYGLVAGLARARAALTGSPPVIDAWAVRLPSTLAALGCVLLLVLAVPGRRGLLAGLILATAFHFTWLGRIGRIDMPLALTTTLAVGAFYRGAWGVGREAVGRLRLCLFPSMTLFVGYLAVAAGVLLKGPIGAVLPAAAIAAYLVVEGEWPAFWQWGAWASLARRFGVAWGLPLVLCLTLPWFVWADGYTGGAVFHEFFWVHNVERGLGSSRLPGHPWWLYVPYFLGDFLPWSPLFLLALWLARKYGWWRREPLARLGLAWFLGVFLVLSCSRFKRADYLLPAYPGAALFLACMVHRAGAGSLAHPSGSWLNPRRLLPRLVAPLSLLVVLGWLVRLEWVLPAAEPYRDYRAFAAEVRRQATYPEEVIFFRTEAHALAFHLGKPLTILVEWDRLFARLASPGTRHVVMPAEVWADFPPLPEGLRLVECGRNTHLSGGKHERPLVLVRAARGE